MQGGNLSNQIQPRFLVVFENLLGILPTKADEMKASGFHRLKQWKRLTNTFQLNEQVASKIWFDTMRRSQKFEAITFMDPKMVEPIEEWVDRWDVPIPRVQYFEPDVLARKLAYMPDVVHVLTPYQDHAFKFGSKGRLVGPGDFHMVGV